MSTHHVRVRWFRARPAATAVFLVLALALFSSGLASAANPAGQTTAAGPPADVPGSAGPITPRLYMPFLSRDLLPLLSYRMGFDRGQNPLANYRDLSSLGAGWYQDWWSHVHPEVLTGMKFVHTIRVHQKLNCALWSPNSYDRTTCPYFQPYDYYVWPDRSLIKQAAVTNPGSTWLIGNEIERIDWCYRDPRKGPCPGTTGQDEILPEVYAVAYHELYQLIKTADPTARIAMGSLVEITPLRLQYMTMVWDAYRARYGLPMPVDLWNVHTFVLSEAHYGAADIPAGLPITSVGFQDNGTNHLNLAMMQQQVRDFRAWVKARELREGLPQGELQNKDLILPEYGVLLPQFSEQQVQDYMVQSFDWFLNARDCTLGNLKDGCRLVQGWAWFSLDVAANFNRNGYLFDPGTHLLTNTGQVFRDYFRTRAPVFTP